MIFLYFLMNLESIGKEHYMILLIITEMIFLWQLFNIFVILREFTSFLHTSIDSQNSHRF